jgi:hypothetical protein
VGEGVVRPELNQPAVDLKPVRVAALEGEKVGHDAQNVDVVRLTLEDAGVEIELEIQLTLIRESRHGDAGGGWFVSFIEVFALMRHDLPPERAAGLESGPIPPLDGSG